MLELSGFDLKRAQLVPQSVFDNPSEVATASFLSFAQKQAILRRWEFDARRMQGGAEGGSAPLLEAVRRALREVAADRSRLEGGEAFNVATPFDPASIGDFRPAG
jgi:hypothetical protein